MACPHRTVIEDDSGVIDCAAINGIVEVTSCDDDEVTCAYGKAVTNGHAIVRAYELTATDYERPRYVNGDTDVTSARFVEQMKPRPTRSPEENLKVFNLQEGDTRIQGSVHNP